MFVRLGSRLAPLTLALAMLACSDVSGAIAPGAAGNLSPGTIARADLQVTEKEITISAPGVKAQVVDYLITRGQDNADQVHMESSSPGDDFRVVVTRARFYPGDYILRVYGDSNPRPLGEARFKIPDGQTIQEPIVLYFASPGPGASPPPAR
jgi:hypothetical protein